MTAPVSPGDVVLDKYRVERVLGFGGMGVVVAATHVELDQKVALKFLLPGALAHPTLVERFAREAKAAARIQSQHVVRVIDTGKMPNGAPFMVMEYLEGHDLDEVLERDGALSPSMAIDYVLQACEAIGEAHSAGIVHRDLKPSNLFLAQQRDRRLVIKVLDFGISKIVDPSSAPLTHTAALMGSPLYMSPEQLMSAKDVDARSDIWALGVVLYELIAGQRPFAAETMPEIVAGILRNQPRRLSEVRPDIPLELDAVISRCLRSDPKERFQSVAELAAALTRFAGDAAAASASAARISRVLGGATLPPNAVQRSVPKLAVAAGDPMAATMPLAPTAPAVELGQAQPEAETFPPTASRRLVPLAALSVVALGVVAALAVRSVSSGSDPKLHGAALVATSAAVASALAPSASLEPLPSMSSSVAASATAVPTVATADSAMAPPKTPIARPSATVKAIVPPPSPATSAASTPKSPLNMGIK